MNLTTLILQIIFTIPLTILLSSFNKKDNRALNYILIPTIYIIVLAALIPSIKTNIFLIVIFEIFIRNFYVTNIVNRDLRISVKSFLIESLLSVALSLFTYNYFISKVDTVVPDPEEIKAFLWFLLIIYCIYLYKTFNKDKQVIKENKAKNNNKEQIIVKYAKFKNMYSSYIKTEKDIIKNMIYAIMIYNDNQNPKLYRNIREYIGMITKKETSYSIMQIPSFNKIKDEEGIELTVSDFENRIKSKRIKEQDQIDKLLSSYNPKAKEEILKIYNEIIEFEKK
jgi:glucan phosphoethanolaminetransferase (alkaline phosphatase superfamily)